MAKGKKTGGRVAGTPNKTTRAFKSAVLDAFNSTTLGGVNGLIDWAKDNRTEFYKIAARLIPTEIVGPGDDGEHKVTVTFGGRYKPLQEQP